jgi:flavin-binding protein dodecin
MSANDFVYKTVELTGTSTKSVEDAINIGVARAAKTLRQLEWFEVIETRGQIRDGKIAHWQVTLKLGMRLED